MAICTICGTIMTEEDSRTHTHHPATTPTKGTELQPNVTEVTK